MEMKIETIVQETIKPSSPTPNHLHNVDLSVYDRFLPPVYTIAVLFYSAADYKNGNSNISQENPSKKLKNSLSDTLTRFYPFAGRISNGVCIDCNDEGAVFVEARTDCLLSDFLKSPDFTALQRFLPLDAVVNPYEASVTWPLLLVKATFFGCGGLAIGVCISHKIADAASITTFVKTWAAVARGDDGDAMKNPEFTASKFFPPTIRNPPMKLPEYAEVLHRKICVTKRFVFDASVINELRAKAASAQVAEPTRVEAVTALLWKCALAASNSTSEKFLPKVLVQPKNLRPEIPSLLSENVIGNILYSSVDLKTGDQQGGVEIQETVRELRTKKEEFKGLIQDGRLPPSTVIVKIVTSMLNGLSQLSHETLDPYSVSSWCKLPLYEASFGWGSPVWVAGNVASALNKVMMLMDSKDGKGIEAWVTLPEPDMSLFEQDPELLAFASPNPCVLI